jgi:hypothetical protein
MQTSQSISPRRWRRLGATLNNAEECAESMGHVFP